MTPACGTRRVDAVLFDMDGTLYSTSECYKAAWAAAGDQLAAHHLDLPTLIAAYDLARPGLRGTDAIAATCAALGAGDEVATMLEQVADTYLPTALPAHTGALALLGQLRDAGIATGLVTNGTLDQQNAKVAALGLAGLLDVVVVAGITSMAAKPDPAPFLAALAALGVRADWTLFVGDNPGVDIAPAVALGMHTARLTGGHYASHAPTPGCGLDTDEPERVWDYVRSLTGLS